MVIAVETLTVAEEAGGGEGGGADPGAPGDEREALAAVGDEGPDGEHGHPGGEVCMVLPITPGAQFDGTDRGWCVFEPGTAHHPTVTNGRALILYMLPDGKIEFAEPRE